MATHTQPRELIRFFEWALDTRDQIDRAISLHDRHACERARWALTLPGGDGERMAGWLKRVRPETTAKLVRDVLSALRIYATAASGSRLGNVGLLFDLPAYDAALSKSLNALDRTIPKRTHQKRMSDAKARHLLTLIVEYGEYRTVGDLLSEAGVSRRTYETSKVFAKCRETMADIAKSRTRRNITGAKRRGRVKKTLSQ